MVKPLRSPPVRLIAGLGNPGTQYADTRHNVGFWWVDRLAAQWGQSFRHEARYTAEVLRHRLDATDCILVKPMAFMNLSGGPVAQVAAFYRIPPEEILVVHDDLDLPVGTVRLKRGGGHGGHNGLRDLHRHLGADYTRLRLGIGHPQVRDAVLGHVLGRPTPVEEQALRHAVERSLEEVPTLLSGDWDAAVRRLHATATATAATPPRPVP